METTDKYRGHTLDQRYQLLGPLGQGGVGTVYVARHTLIGKRLAVKIVDAEELADDATTSRLFREAEAAAAIGHPNIIDVIDVGLTATGDPYLVMELLDGEDLANYLAREGHVSVAAACAVLEPVLLALSAAHDKQIVHRDIKPANIFLPVAARPQPDDARLSVKLIDFGIAKVGGAGRTRLTTDGALLGTPSYMSPEQARGATQIDARADLYGVGLVFYEMLTGELPFTGSNYNDVIHRIVHDEVELPDPLPLPIPPPVIELIQKALRKSPEERFQTASEMLQALSGLAEWTERHSAGLQLAGDIQPAPTPTSTNDAVTQVSARGPEAGESRSAEPTAPAVEPAAVRRSKPAAWGVSVAVGGVVLLTLAALSAPEDADAPPSAGVTPTGLPSAKPGAVAGDSRQVRITLNGLPRGATVHYAGEVVSDNPFSVPATDIIMPIFVELEGYEPFSATIVPSSDRTLQVSLKPRPAAGSRTSQPDAAPQMSSGPTPARNQAIRKTASGNTGNTPEQAEPEPSGSTQPPGQHLGRTGRDSLYIEKFE